MTDQFKNEWNAGYEKGRDDYCCNQNCNQGRDCPLRKKEMKNEPVAWINKTTFQYLTELGYSAKVYPKRSDGDIPLYTHPVKEQLTDEEIHHLMDEIRQAVGDDIERAMYRMARAILRKAQEK